MPSIESVSLAAAVLLLISIFSSKLANKVGIPSLLFFLLTGWLIAEFGVFQVNNPGIAKFIGDFALIFILFTGGLDSQWENIRPILWQGLCLSTLGVLITMLLLGSFAWFVLGSFSSFSVVSMASPLLRACFWHLLSLPPMRLLSFLCYVPAASR